VVNQPVIINMTGPPERYERRIVVFLGCSCSMHLIEIIHPLNRASGYFNQDFANLVTLDRPVEKLILRPSMETTTAGYL
jgi:hypothetical protein